MNTNNKALRFDFEVEVKDGASYQVQEVNESENSVSIRVVMSPADADHFKSLHTENDVSATEAYGSWFMTSALDFISSPELEKFVRSQSHIEELEV